MVALAQGTWVIVADGEKALFMENITDAEDPNLVIVSVEEQDQQGSGPADRAGRRNDYGPHQKSAVEEPSWKTHAKTLFVQDLANVLNRKGLTGAFKRLVLVASPQVLGLLRRRLHSDVLAKVVAEVDKTLTNHPMNKVEQVLHQRLQPSPSFA